MYVLNANHISKSYKTAGETMRILQNVNLQVMKGEMVAIMGPSGSGKTTLLHVLTGVDTPDDGEIVIGGETFSQLTEEEKAFFRRKHMGMIFQDFQLLESLTVKENILLPCNLDGKKVEEKHLQEIIELLGLSNREEHLPNQLSGGQQQRVAIGRAIINNPSIILADEPTGNLDSKSSKEIIELLKKSNKKYNQTILLITHDMSIAEQADRIIKIQDGKIVK